MIFPPEITAGGEKFVSCIMSSEEYYCLNFAIYCVCWCYFYTVKQQPFRRINNLIIIIIKKNTGQEDPLEKEMTTLSNILAWRIPWTERSGGLQSKGLQSQTWLSKQIYFRVFLHFPTNGYFGCLLFFYTFKKCCDGHLSNMPLLFSHAVVSGSYAISMD